MSIACLGLQTRVLHATDQRRIPQYKTEEKLMKLKVIIHEAEEGGFWAEVPAIPGCMTQGETIKDLIENLYDAVEGCLSIDMNKIPLKQNDTVMELTV
jgi:predicted RNase H-like HicB family nuclease